MTTPNQIVDHTLLAPTATPDEIEALCRDARDNRFYSVCVSPTFVARAASLVEGSDVHVCTVVGFPSGAHTSAVKAYETRTVVEDGADEIDMVMNLASAKAHDWAAVESDFRAVVEAAQGRIVKVILETCVLEDDEIVAACVAARAAGADFVKTSTGFAGGGATTHAVQLMRETVGPDMGVKASGGIRTAADLDAMVAAGATRIGSSAGAALLTAQGN